MAGTLAEQRRQKPHNCLRPEHGKRRCQAGRHARRQAMGVWSTGCALCLVASAHAAAPSFYPGPRGAASLGGLSPAGPSSPASPTPKLGRGRSVARALDLERANAAPDRYAEVITSVAALATTGSHPRDAIDRQVIDGGGAARWQAATARR